MKYQVKMEKRKRKKPKSVLTYSISKNGKIEFPIAQNKMQQIKQGAPRTHRKYLNSVHTTKVNYLNKKNGENFIVEVI